MRVVLLAAATSLAALLAAAPAAALDPAHSQFTSGSAANVTVHRGRQAHSDGDFRSHRRHDRRRHRGDDGVLFYGDREYQGDTAWRAESYNDWWHERPHRSFPRWVANNQGCERVWQGGGVWRCSW